MNKNMKFMSIDYGLKRVGFAISDKITNCVFPVCTLDRTVKSTFFTNMQELVQKHEPDVFVLGLPYNEDGSPCITTSQVKNFAKSLERRFSQPIVFMDEFLSSYEAEENLKNLGIKAKKVKKIVDQEAAILILQSFLNSWNFDE